MVANETPFCNNFMLLCGSPSLSMMTSGMFFYFWVFLWLWNPILDTQDQLQWGHRNDALFWLLLNPKLAYRVFI